MSAPTRMQRILRAADAFAPLTQRFSTVTPAGFDAEGRPLFHVSSRDSEETVAGRVNEDHDEMAGRLWPGRLVFEVVNKFRHSDGGDGGDAQ